MLQSSSLAQASLLHSFVQREFPLTLAGGEHILPYAHKFVSFTGGKSKVKCIHFYVVPPYFHITRETPVCLCHLV